jgi:integrase
MALLYTGKNLKLYHLPCGRGGKEGHQIRYKDGNGKQVRKVAPATVDPYRWAKEMDNELNTVQHLDRSDHMFGDVIKEYISELEERVENYKSDARYGEQLSPGTYKKWRVHLDKHIVPHFQKADLAKITPTKVLDFQTQLLKKIKPQTINDVVGTLSRSMSFFVVKEYIVANPCREIKKLQTKSVEQGYTPTPEEVHKVINGIDELWKKALVKLCAETGLRISEALALEWSSIRKDQLYVKQSVVQGVVGKTKTKGSERKIMMSSTLTSLLAEHRLRSTSKDFVFVNERGNLLSASDALKQVLKPACNAVNVREFGWHGLRRGYITQLFKKGVREDHVQTLAGHAPGSKVTRSIYNKVREEDVLIDDYVIEFPT